ncbi:phage tail terminator-like protein [Chromobacterium vaccinii]|uniref:Tail terminator n=1 Tax=Chromobacterium vaccinii TaxID=1108595 RepID=A0A1D9LC51_9NEIS|nr:phage tail terminator-like protein [Chromobacterium vaccinii]AOZ48842.1 hypothetical protein BKX93_01740 [Chromobacterium vaccinii]
MTPSDMEAALCAHLAQLTAYPIAWEDVTFTPDLARPYLRVDNLPAGSVAAGIGEDAMNRAAGIFQVMACTATGEGTGLAGQMADQVEALFRRGLALPASDGFVRVDKPPSRGRAIHTDTWSYLPISISYYGYCNP